ncbi:hypothetical protein SEA_EJIMIX_119 [Mycobacterium phage Ejimix]|nr:hypothetical protein SEA_HALLEY_127 [Mycobacterium phage Halley]AXQ52238.1 hypothetical protein SEA_EJIMIX_119 [Mycobacterium phage Ejimix]QBJ00188.1 hypothetical protein SEA_PHOEBUS_126 [Mycobacterium phage Phoebus]QDM55701.1 hypothetical protein SEA_HOKKEND_115 [Mycobacterium phage HokkenD]QDP43871.1 hypothetical protein SEA_DALLAS_126 [Mycobacterium phage Dallas]QZD97998.1 hypothetical protein SEA_BEEM_127 [Mycobacterium phage Beem]UEM46608.1 hypothetical protein SEA_JUICYJAY_122 [Mycob
MSDTQTISIIELEEMLSSEVPCGGNSVPVARDCPHNAPATLISRHQMTCTGNPRALKCADCHLQWLRYALSRSGWGRCAGCGRKWPAEEMYQPL